ncbi:MAG: hypothetical protein KDC44_02705, partial [Phaeodactylibacter sp.]|nr:hypothetical protein [Phaeodactylibacter sp.]
MDNSKLMEVIDVLSVEELERLQLFLQSPLFNAGPQAAELALLLQHIREGMREKEAVYERLYPDTPFSRSKFDKLMSALLKHIHRFILLDQNRPDQELAERFQLLHFFRERGLERHYQSILKKLEKQLEAAGPKEGLSYWQFLLKEERVTYQAAKNLRSDDLHVPDLLHQLDRFYLLSKLKYSVLLLSQNIHISLNVEDSLQMLEALMPVLEGPEFEADPPLQAFQQAYQLLRKHPAQDTHAEFLELRRQLRKNGHLLATDTHKMLHSLLRIHAVSLYNAGRQDFLQAAFELYQEHLKLGYLYYEGKLQPSTFRNIVTLGLRFGALEWVEQFLTAHQARITGTEYSEELFSFNRAQLYFFQKRYDEALDQLADKYVELY